MWTLSVNFGSRVICLSFTCNIFQKNLVEDTHSLNYTLNKMAKKKQKSKISSIKRGNQLRTKLMKQGKLKVRRNRAKPKKVSRPPATANTIAKTAEDEYSSEEEEENVLDMIEEEDIHFLQKAISNKSYALLKNINVNSEEIEKKPQRQKKTLDDDSEFFENQYELENQNSHTTKKKKYLLPIKTSEGVVVRSEEVNESEEEMEEEDKKVIAEETKPEESEEIKEARAADLLARRENSLMKSKFRIGSLCSGLTENPELKINNFKPLLEMVTKNNPEVCITGKKLALMSLLEVFKDLLPAYQIKHQKDPKVKLKKAVKQLYSYESNLLRYYKDYLQKIEKLISILKRKKGDNRIFKEPEIKLAEMGMQCLCDLLTTHPYFNFSKNLVHLLVPFLNNGRESVRGMVSAAVKQIFSTDKRGELSLEIVRNINKLVKSKSNITHSEVLKVCLSLRIKDVNLDKEKEEELKKKKETAKKHKFMKMSKRERKRNKKFQHLENELLETKAEESKKSREHFLTEITKTLFTIYFRILKVTPSSKLLNAALEGLAKFAHCINIEFYQDLVMVLNNLTQNHDLGYKERLSCVQTVFTVLYYQGATINIDPIQFYSHFYANILKINAGKNHSDLPIILKTTDFVLLKRRKHLSLQRLLAFTKRLTALAIQVLPNGSLALLSLIKQILQVNNSTDILLDLESGQGQGVYYPELDEPECCNADATSLWELLPLQRHYHPTVRECASHLAKLDHKAQGAQVKGSLKQSPEQLFEEYDSTLVKFNPAVPPPKKFPKNKRKRGLLQDDFENFLENTLKRQKIVLNESFTKTKFYQE